MPPPGFHRHCYYGLYNGFYEQLQRLDCKMNAEMVGEYIDMIRKTVRNMVTMRRHVLKSEARELRDAYDDAELSDKRVEEYMRAHRKNSNQSHAQTIFWRLDADEGLRPHQVKERLGNRFLLRLLVVLLQLLLLLLLRLMLLQLLLLLK